MSAVRPVIDICPDYGGCFNFGEGGASSLPDELRLHARISDIMAIEKGLSVWADWFDSNDPYSPNRYFPLDAFNRTGRSLATELQDIIGDEYVVLFRHQPLEISNITPEL